MLLDKHSFIPSNYGFITERSSSLKSRERSKQNIFPKSKFNKKHNKTLKASLFSPLSSSRNNTPNNKQTNHHFHSTHSGFAPSDLKQWSACEKNTWINSSPYLGNYNIKNCITRSNYHEEDKANQRVKWLHLNESRKLNIALVSKSCLIAMKNKSRIRLKSAVNNAKIYLKTDMKSKSKSKFSSNNSNWPHVTAKTNYTSQNNSICNSTRCIEKDADFPLDKQSDEWARPLSIKQIFQTLLTNTQQQRPWEDKNNFVTIKKEIRAKEFEMKSVLDDWARMQRKNDENLKRKCFISQISNVTGDVKL